MSYPVLEKISELLMKLSTKKRELLGLAIILALLKVYCRGTKCKAYRELFGKVAVVTGGNTGIGKATVQGLVKHKCSVIIGARDGAKSAKAIQDIKSKYADADVVAYTLDLADRESIRSFSAQVAQRVQRVDILINNAAVMGISPRMITNNGFEMHMGINHLGHFYLTSLLWTSLTKSDSPRVITVSGEAHEGLGYPKKNLQIDFTDFNYRNNYNSSEAYSRSKAANILFAKQLQHRMDLAGIRGLSFSLHPGVTRTELLRHLSFGSRILLKLLYPLQLLLMKNSMQGAQTTLYLALQSSDRLRKGDYYAECAPARNSRFTNNMDNAKLLWEKSEQELRISFELAVHKARQLDLAE